MVVPITDTTAEWFGRIKQGLCRIGRPIPMNDVWIAAILEAEDVGISS